jgi:phosphatidylinositol alpha-1,6-mannosyltransferase
MSSHVHAASHLETHAHSIDAPDVGGPHLWRPAVLLLSELYPPAVGGTPVLFEAVYSRLKQTPVIVLADNKIGNDHAARETGVTVVRKPLATRHWSLLDWKGFRQHLFVAREVRRLGARGQVIVHCARALPEGVAAWLSACVGGPSYTCWAHGEDIATAHHSREFTWLMTRVYRGAAATIANSHNTAGMLEALGVARDRIHVVHPGVDVQRFHPQNDGAPIRARFNCRDRIVLLSVGRLQRRKGHDLVLEALRHLGGSLPLTYLIVGDGEERERLERLTSEYRLQDCVHFAGEVSSLDLPRYYAASDIFLLPNRIHDGDVEGFGIVFLEAAATGRPSIGGRTGGVPEAVADQETGLLVSGTDAAELASAIAVLAASKPMREAMGAAGRQRVCSGFTWERAAAGVSAVHAQAALRTGRG